MATFNARICSWIDDETQEALARARKRGLTVSDLIRAGLFALLQGGALEDERSALEEHDDDNPPREAGGLLTDERSALEDERSALEEHDDDNPPREAGGLLTSAERASDTLDDERERQTWEALSQGWLILGSACDRDPIKVARVYVCEPTPDPEQDQNSNGIPQRSRARCFDPAARAQESSPVDPARIVELWQSKRDSIAARWSIAGMVGGGGVLRSPRPAVLGEALRRRLAHASRRLPTLAAWEEAFAALADVPAHAVNRLYLWELDRLCRIPLEENEQEAFRALPPEERPCFAERLSAYASWNGRKRPPPAAVVESAPLASSPSPSPRRDLSPKAKRAGGWHDYRSPSFHRSPQELAEERARSAREAARAKAEADARAKAEADARAKAEADARAKAEADERLREAGLARIRELRSRLHAKSC